MSIAAVLTTLAGVAAAAPVELLPGQMPQFLSYPRDSSFPTVYEVSTRPWLYELGQKHGRDMQLKDISEEDLDDIPKDIDAIWLMGVWSLGPYGRELDLLDDHSDVLPDYTDDDVIGSPYAITEYEINPEIGTEQDLALFREKISQRGWKLILDFVPNHSAVDSPWVEEDPQQYVLAPKDASPPFDPEYYLDNGVAMGRDPYYGAWTDTAQLNYWNPQFRNKMIGILEKTASMADGVRCDMAMLVFNGVIDTIWGDNLRSWGYDTPSQEFWAEAIPHVKSIAPEFVFIAEGYDWDMCGGSCVDKLMDYFDYTYEKVAYDKLRIGHIDNIKAHIAGNSEAFHSLTQHFTENHDEDRAAYGFPPNARANAASAISFTLPGSRLMFRGQEFGYANRLSVHLRRATPEDRDVETTVFYDRLLEILKAPVFHNGQWSFSDVSDDPQAWRMMAWRWTDNLEKRLVVVNYSDGTGAGRVVLPDVSDSDVHELMSGTVYHRDINELRTVGLMVVLEAWQVQIFSYA